MKLNSLNLYDEQDDYLPPNSEQDVNDQEVLEQIGRLKSELKEEVLVLGHHYQSDEIISFADETGDSLALAKKAASANRPYIIFCGVHFMAETADILTSEGQKVILPDLNAGCSMADMANRMEVDQAWNFLINSTRKKIVPITYINCAATLKAFVGENDGSICTSSNARAVIEWAFSRGEKLLFFPDQHLGRNTCYQMGIPLSEMVVYNPKLKNGGLSAQQVEQAKVILWYGHCSVHQGFTLDQILKIKKMESETTVIVHPECNFEVVQAADLSGSTSYIIETIEKSPPGSKFAVGTEINLVNRLAKKYKNKVISSLSPYQCLCTTMYRVRPRWLLKSFQAIKSGSPANVISVPRELALPSLKALDNMLNIS